MPKERVVHLNRTIDWYMLWSIMADQGLVDAVGGAEYKRRTKELIDVDVIAQSDGVAVTDFASIEDYPHDALYLTKTDAREELFLHFADGKFSFLASA
jgi:hypothetical protein